MTSINFDNPYLLLLAIPMMMLIIIPYFIAIKKENKSKSAVITLCIHTAIVLLVSLAIAGMHLSTVKTETEVIVVADVSYSTSRDLEKIDGYINELMKEENLPINTKVGVVCFGKNQHLNTPVGGTFVSVANSLKGDLVDDGVTDISSALDYASTLFSPTALKRIVLITDGEQNTSSGSSGLVNSIKNMDAKQIVVDAIYTDSNLQSGEYEVQVISVDYVGSTYKDKETYVDILIQSNTDYVLNTDKPKDRNDAVIRLFDGEGNLIKEITKPLDKGFNMVSVKLDTSEAGIKEYKVTVEANHDTSTLNNFHSFAQSVTDEYKVLLLSRLESDYKKARELFGDKVKIDAPLMLIVPDGEEGAEVNVPDGTVPYSLEELCRYDAFIVSGVDIKTVKNPTALVANMNTAVSKFGKTLITAGNLNVQNGDDVVYDTLENMLAVKYGNTVSDAKLYALVIDTSRSMQDAYQLIMAKESAIQVLNLMAPQDYVMVIGFSGEVTVVQKATPAANREAVAEVIMGLQPTQGTVIGSALRATYDQMKEYDFLQKQVILISDGRSYGGEDDDNKYPEDVAAEMAKDGIFTSVINTNSRQGEELLSKIQASGKGKYYFVESPEDVSGKLSNDISDNINETVKENVNATVNIEKYNDPLVLGFTKVPNIKGYYITRAKSNATVVLSTVYKTPSEVEMTVPVCAYWNYEKGRVVSLTTAFSGTWVSAWENEVGEEFYRRMLIVNTPEEKIDYPFNFNVSYEGANATVEIIPGEMNPDITVELEIIAPNGESVHQSLSYDAGAYSTDYEILEPGRYIANVEYVYGNDVFSASVGFDVAYMPEYDRFELFDSAILYNAIGNGGTVSENGNLVIVTDEDDEQIHTVYLTVQLMVMAVILYVIDIIVRKLKWSDIKSLFKIHRAGGNIK